MSKFSEAFSNLIDCKVIREDYIRLTGMSSLTITDVRYGRRQTRRSTAKLCLAASRTVVRNMKKRLDDCLAELEKAYEEEFDEK